MNRFKFYREVNGKTEIDRPLASARKWAWRTSAAGLNAAAARLGFRKTKRPHTIACPFPSRRYLAQLRHTAQHPGRGRRR